MNREDASAVPWMAQHRREAAPKKVVWYQDDVTHDQFYWLAVPPGQASAGSTVVASVVGQEVRVEQAEGSRRCSSGSTTAWSTLTEPVRVTSWADAVRSGKLPRSAATLERTLASGTTRS